MKTLRILPVLLLLCATISCDTDEADDGPPPVIDLEATSIDFFIANRENFDADATITGTITNIADDFSSGEGQQTVILYERQLGAPANSNGTEVARVDFTNLAAGETRTVSFTRRWFSSSSSDGEFPPDFRMVLSYDPDLFLDGNEDNDDTNIENNFVERNGQGINMLFN